MSDYEVIIPTEIEHTKQLSCLVEPPHDKMTITLADSDGNTFLVGKIANRRCPCIDAFIKRPQKLNRETRQRDQPLKAGDKIQVTVTLFNKVENTADGPVFSDEITKVKENVTIT